MLIRGAQLYAELPDQQRSAQIMDLRCRQGHIVEIAQQLQPEPGEPVIDAGGGAVIRGLHDHHIHLLALAASYRSVLCGPPGVASLQDLHEALQRANSEQPGGGWLRGYGYHQSVAGELDRYALDAIIDHRPVRIQHRSGKLWILNSAAIEQIKLHENSHMAGVECSAEGEVNGRLMRCDEWLREQLGDSGHIDLSSTSARLASFGITGVTDAGADNDAQTAELLQAAIDCGQLKQSVLMMGSENLPAMESGHLLRRGAVKLLLDEYRLPDINDFSAIIVRAHNHNRPVAIHCVTRTELVFALAALEQAGLHIGDRIEHASVVPDELLPLLKQVPITVVTQHGFIAQRGDQYLRDVAPQFHSALYRGRAFIDAGIALAGSSDAPYGDPDPWATMRAACRRTTGSGQLLGDGEQLTAEQALALFSGPAIAPGECPEALTVGDRADLCVLNRPWSEVRLQLSSSCVAATLCSGELVFSRQPGG